MKTAIIPIFLIARSCVSLQTPASFLRENKEDKQERELLGLRTCDVKAAWVANIKTALGNTEDPDIQDIAEMALDLLADGEALEIPSNVEVDEDGGTLRQLFADFDTPGVLANLVSLRRQSKLSLFTPIEQRLERLRDVADEATVAAVRTTDFLESLIIQFGINFLSAIEFLINAVRIISSVLFVLLATIPLFLVTLLGGSGEVVATTISYLIYFLFFLPLAGTLALFAQVVSSILLFALCIIPGGIPCGFEGPEAGLDCATKRIMGKLPPIVNSLVRAHQVLVDITEP